MPWPASPPSDFCHDQVATSSLSHGRRMAKAAEVASQIARPSRSAAIQSPFGTRTPEVVPFQVKTTSRAGSTCDRSGSRPYGAFNTRTSGSFSCSTSVTQPSPKFSQVSMSTPRAPSSDHIAISIAPVSEPATIPTRQSAGMPRIARERSTTSTSRASPTAERCERPASAPASTVVDHPGRLAHGPDEKHGLAGRRFGFMTLFLRDSRAATYGRGLPASMRPTLRALRENPRKNLEAAPATIDKAIRVSSLDLDPRAALREWSREAKQPPEGGSRERQQGPGRLRIPPCFLATLPLPFALPPEGTDGWPDAPSPSLPLRETQGKNFSGLALHRKVVSNQCLVRDSSAKAEARQGSGRESRKPSDRRRHRPISAIIIVQQLIFSHVCYMVRNFALASGQQVSSAPHGWKGWRGPPSRPSAITRVGGGYGHASLTRVLYV